VLPSTLAVADTIQAPAAASHTNLVVTASGLLVGSGDESLVAIDLGTGRTRWSTDIASPGDPTPCTALAVAASIGRLYCGNRFGALEERDLATGQSTGVRLDPQTGSIGALAVTEDERQLVAFGRDASVVARWALDGGGPIVIGRADGLLAERYDPTGRFLIVVRSDAVDTLDASVWDTTTGAVVDELDEIDRVPLWQAPGLLAAAFTDGTLGTYDVAAHARIARHDRADRGALAGAAVSAGGRRIYVNYLDH
jgi:outer membrane protein assembly factor BamB